jgi:flagellar biosynthesis protein FliR
METLLAWLDTPHIMGFWLIVMRLTGLFLTAPLFSHASIPLMVKSQWVTVLAFMLATLTPPPALITSEGQLVLLAMQEVAIGGLLGMAAQLILTSFQLAGEFMATQMGLNMAGIMDPVSHQPSTAIANLVGLFALLLFIGLDGHHWLIAGVAQSLHHIPLGATGLVLTQTARDTLLQWPQHLFTLGLGIALPVVGTMLLIDVAAGYLAKTMPQLNLLTLTPTVKILVGLSIISATLTNQVAVMQTQVKQLPQTLGKTLPVKKAPPVKTIKNKVE